MLKIFTLSHAPAYTHSHTRTHTNTHAHTHTHTHTHTYSYTHTYTYTHKRGQARAVSPYLNWVSPRVYSQVVSLYDYVLKESVSLYNTLQHPATPCNTLQHSAKQLAGRRKSAHFATHCNKLQHTWLIGTRVLIETHCNALQRTATHYNTLQHTATHLAGRRKRGRSAVLYCKERSLQRTSTHMSMSLLVSTALIVTCRYHYLLC